MKYWSEKQNNLILKIKNTEDKRERDKYYVQLQPAIKELIRGIIAKYYLTYASGNLTEVVADCEQFISERELIRKFNDNKTTNSYAYLGTSVKNHLYERYVRHSDKYQQVALYDGDTVNPIPTYDLSDEQTEPETDIADVRKAVAEKVGLLLSNSDNEVHRKILTEVLLLVNETHWSKEYATYRILKSVEGITKCKSIYLYLYRLNLHHLISKARTLKGYRNVLGDLTDDQQIRERLLSLQDQPTKGFFKQNRKKRKNQSI